MSEVIKVNGFHPMDESLTKQILHHREVQRKKLNNRRALDILYQRLEKAGAKKAKKIRARINTLIGKQMQLFKKG